MTVRADGSVECDGCGVDLGNGSLELCVIVLDTGPVEEGGVRKYHLCRTRVGDNGQELKGCGMKMLSAKVLAHFNKTREGVTTDAATANPNPEP